MKINKILFFGYLILFALILNYYLYQNTANAQYSFQIHGIVYEDNVIQNGLRDQGEPAYGGATVNLSGTSTGQRITGPGGFYQFTSLQAGNYTVTLTVPAGYSSTTTNPVLTTLGPDDTIFFGIYCSTCPPAKYSISGNVFIDSDGLGTKNGTEVNYTAAPISITYSPIIAGSAIEIPDSTTNAAGSYRITGLTAGTYSVSYDTAITPIPSGFSMTRPQGTPPTFIVTVGPLCTPDTWPVSPGYSCF